MKRTSKRTARRPEKVEMAFLEAVRKRCPGDEQVLEALGDLYTRTGRFEEGLLVDLDLVQRRPQDARVWYNLACSFSLTGKIDEAFNALGRSFSMGYDDFEHLSADPDLEPLRRDPRYQELMARFKRDCECPF